MRNEEFDFQYRPPTHREGPLSEEIAAWLARPRANRTMREALLLFSEAATSGLCNRCVQEALCEPVEAEWNKVPTRIASGPTSLLGLGLVERRFWGGRAITREHGGGPKRFLVHWITTFGAAVAERIEEGDDEA